MTSHADEADGGLEIAPGVRVDPSSIQIDFVSSSGPGGQNVNKRATKAQLRIALADIPISDPARERLGALAGARLSSDGVLLLSSDETRSQKRNRQACLSRLRELIVRATHPPRVRKPTRVPRRAIERRLDDKRRRSETKQNRKPPQ